LTNDHAVTSYTGQRPTANLLDYQLKISDCGLQIRQAVPFIFTLQNLLCIDADTQRLEQAKSQQPVYYRVDSVAATGD
jgi:hypothetical protein